jgi:hypothetical protein
MLIARYSGKLAAGSDGGTARESHKEVSFDAMIDMPDDFKRRNRLFHGL